MTPVAPPPRESTYDLFGVEVPKATVWLYAGLTVIVLAIVIPALVPMGEARFKFPRDPRRTKLMNIGLALMNYRDAHGVFPHDPRGDEYALYAIFPYTWQVTDFDILKDKLRKAAWDHLHGKIEHGDILYWNRPELKQIRLDRVLIVAPGGDGKGYFCGTMDASVFYLKTVDGDPRSLLGTLAPDE